MQNNSGDRISYQELEELVDWIKRVYRFDLGGYSRASLKRRVSRFLEVHNFSLFDLRSLLVNDHSFFEEFISGLSVTVTEMFRDPGFYRVINEKVMPYLATFPGIRIWSAGCATGEETYSLAILLKIQDLLHRSFIYGTDINARAISFAKEGIFELQKMRQYSRNFLMTGAGDSLSDFYVARYDAAAIKADLRKNILFAVHNLVSDGVFNEFQMISCRNVLIYFNIELQKRVLKLFCESLSPFGFLCLGAKETLRGEEILAKFKIIDKTANIYQKIS